MPTISFRLNGVETDVEADPDRSLLDILLAEPAYASDDAERRTLIERCVTTDVVLIDIVELPVPRRGDLLAVPATGAYTLAMSSTYNAVPRPAAVLVREGRARLINLAERQPAENRPGVVSALSGEGIGALTSVIETRLGESRFHRKAAAPGFVPRISARDEFIERDRAVAGPQSARRTKIGNAAFGRNAGASEGQNGGGLGDHVAELFHAAAKIRCDHGETICKMGRTKL